MATTCSIHSIKSLVKSNHWNYYGYDDNNNNNNNKMNESKFLYSIQTYITINEYMIKRISNED